MPAFKWQKCFLGTKSPFFTCEYFIDHWIELHGPLEQFDVPSPDKSVDVLTSIKLAIAAWRVTINVSRDFQKSDSVLGLVGPEGVGESWVVTQLTPVAFHIGETGASWASFCLRWHKFGMLKNINICLLSLNSPILRLSK